MSCHFADIYTLIPQAAHIRPHTANDFSGIFNNKGVHYYSFELLFVNC